MTVDTIQTYSINTRISCTVIDSCLTVSASDIIVGVASSLSPFTLMSVLFLTIRLACGGYCRRKWKKCEDKSTEKQQTCTAQPAQPNLLYEDVTIQEQELEFKENAAYGAISQFSI